MAPLPSPPRARIGAPDFNQHGEDWPHRDASEFHRVGQAIWHIQRMGPTTHADDTPPPIALLLHGTGASTHSLMDVMPLVARTHDTIAIDLPGHGFTQTPASFQPNQVAVAKAIKALLQQLGVQPSLIVGHSAGAAVMLALADDGLASSTALVSLNGALTPFPGIAQVLFPPTSAAALLREDHGKPAGGKCAKPLARGATARTDGWLARCPLYRPVLDAPAVLCARVWRPAPHGKLGPQPHGGHCVSP
ncbi:MAG: alpha/beta fold hydrolase [Pseudomonadota bacterium]